MQLSDENDKSVFNKFLKCFEFDYVIWRGEGGEGGEKKIGRLKFFLNFKTFSLSI